MGHASACPWGLVTAHAARPAPYPSSGNQVLSCSSLHQGWEAEPDGCEELPPPPPRERSRLCPSFGGDFLGLVGPGKGRALGRWLCAGELEPTLGFALKHTSDWAEGAKVFPRSHDHHQGWVWRQESGQQPRLVLCSIFFFLHHTFCQGAQRHRAEGALAFCPPPITSLQSQLDLGKKDLPSEITDLMKITVKIKCAENSSQGNGLCWSEWSLCPSNLSGLMDNIDIERLMLLWDCASSTKISVGCFPPHFKVFSRVKFCTLPFCSNLDEAWQARLWHFPWNGDSGSLANPNPAVHLKAADCCSKLGLDVPRREMLHLVSHRDELWDSGSSLYLGHLHIHPKPTGTGVRSSCPICISRFRCFIHGRGTWWIPHSSCACCSGMEGTKNHISHGFWAAHSPPCPLLMTVVLRAVAAVVLLLLPSNTVSAKLNY